MKNKELAHMFQEIADMLEMQDVQWKPRAYRRAARTISSLSTPIEDVYETGDLEELDGVGEAIAEKIREYLETGHLAYYEELKEELPVDIEALTAVEGIGPKTVKTLYNQLHITNLDELETAAENGEIAELDGFGEKTQQNILDHLALARRGQERTILGEAAPRAAAVIHALEETNVFDTLAAAGSLRRKHPTIGDIDILATAANPEKAMDTFCSLDDVTDILSQGDTKSSVILNDAVQVDLRIVDKQSWGAALMYFTGSKEHNVALRQRALDQEKTLNEYGVFDKDTEENLASETEEAVFNELGLAYIPPELRENTGEIPAAADNALPSLVTVDDMRGDLQMHTTASDGNTSIRGMADAAAAKGYEYIAITDHGPGLSIAGGLTPSELQQQQKEIQDVNDDVDITVLHGVEANITKNGELDLTPEQCKDFDLVLAAYHDSGKDVTEQVCSVLENYPVDILAHPTNRLLLEREGLTLDYDSIIPVAAENNVAMEINANPKRLDMDWRAAKQYRDHIKFVISTDAHSTQNLDFMRYGVYTARKAWLEKKHVLNTQTLTDLKTYFAT